MTVHDNTGVPADAARYAAACAPSRVAAYAFAHTAHHVPPPVPPPAYRRPCRCKRRRHASDEAWLQRSAAASGAQRWSVRRTIGLSGGHAPPDAVSLPSDCLGRLLAHEAARRKRPRLSLRRASPRHAAWRASVEVIAEARCGQPQHAMRLRSHPHNTQPASRACDGAQRARTEGSTMDWSFGQRMCVRPSGHLIADSSNETSQHRCGIVLGCSYEHSLRRMSSS
jgi:hypothetical protein